MKKRLLVRLYIFAISIAVMLLSCKKNNIEINDNNGEENTYFTIYFNNFNYDPHEEYFLFFTDQSGKVTDSIIRDYNDVIITDKIIENNPVNFTIVDCYTFLLTSCRLKTFLDVDVSKWHINDLSGSFLSDINFDLKNFPFDFETRSRASYNSLSSQWGFIYNSGSGYIRPQLSPSCLFISIEDTKEFIYLDNLIPSYTYTVDYNDKRAMDSSYVDYLNIDYDLYNIIIKGYQNNEYPYKTLINGAYGNNDQLNKNCTYHYPIDIFDGFKCSVLFGEKLDPYNYKHKYEYLSYGTIPNTFESHDISVSIDSLGNSKYNINVTGDYSYSCVSFRFFNPMVLDISWDVYIPKGINSFKLPKIPKNLSDILGANNIESMQLTGVKIIKFTPSVTYYEYLKNNFELNKNKIAYIGKEFILYESL